MQVNRTEAARMKAPAANLAKKSGKAEVQADPKDGMHSSKAENLGCIPKPSTFGVKSAKSKVPAEKLGQQTAKQALASASSAGVPAYIVHLAEQNQGLGFIEQMKTLEHLLKHASTVEEFKSLEYLLTHPQKSRWS